MQQFQRNVQVLESASSSKTKAGNAKKNNKKNPTISSTVFVWGNGSETTVSNGGDKPTTDTPSKTPSVEASTINNSSAKNHVSAQEYQDIIRRRCRVLTREELIFLMTILPPKLNIANDAKNLGRTCVGLIGYPNVGKSSVINTILGVSKSTHGKPVY